MPSSDERLLARNDLAWAIAVGGVAAVLFAALLSFAWHFAATLFLIFAGMLLAVALNAMTQLLGHLIRLPQPLRLAIVCLALATLLSGVVVLGGATIAKQATALSDTIKSQVGTVKAFLEKNGVDPSYFEFGGPTETTTDSGGAATPGAPTPGATAPRLPSASALASGGTAIIGQTFKILLGTVSAVGNFFIVLFLGLAFAAQPSVYRAGLIFIAVVVSLFIHALQYGPQAALIGENFPTHLRYGGAGLGYQLASVFAGGPAPLIATWLLHKTGTPYAISAYIVFAAVVTVACVLALPDRSRVDIEDAAVYSR